jgi:probable phosphoglycerate mutase
MDGLSVRSFQLVIDGALTERHMGLFQGWAIDDCKRSEPFKVFIRGGRDTELPVRLWLIIPIPSQSST